MSLRSTFHGALLHQDLRVVNHTSHIIVLLDKAPGRESSRGWKLGAVEAVVAHRRPFGPWPHICLEEALGGNSKDFSYLSCLSMARVTSYQTLVSAHIVHGN